MTLHTTLLVVAATVGLAASLRAGPTEPSPTIRAPLPPLPEAVTSFGAATDEDWLYAFGGHRGKRHGYAASWVSGAFHRLNLREPGTWEALPPGAPGQGQPLIAHRGYIYRVGGMAARNAPGETQDLRSLSLAQRFDPRHSRWEDLPPLPAPRSSHDAAVIGDRLYVVGGWNVQGETQRALWPTQALVLDLNRLGQGWREFPQPFQRRALALATLGARLYCVGGMDKNNQPTLAVEVYDTVSGRWIQGPALPNGRFQGFSCAAVTQAGRVYVSTYQNTLLRLSSDASAWEIAGRLEHPRLAHRLVAAGSAQLIALGGEDGEEKRPTLELLTPTSDPGDAETPHSSGAQAAARPNTQP